MESPLINVKDAAARMGIDYSTLMFGLQQSKFPFGTAVKCRKTWRYIIIPDRFEAYISAQDMKPAEKTT